MLKSQNWKCNRVKFREHQLSSAIKYSCFTFPHIKCGTCQKTINPTNDKKKGSQEDELFASTERAIQLTEVVMRNPHSQ